MRKLFLAAGVATLAIAAPAAAERGGKGGGDRGPKAASVERGGGAAQARAQARGGGEARAARQASRPDRAAVRPQARGGGEARAQRSASPRMQLAAQPRGNSEARARGNNNRPEPRARANSGREQAQVRGNRQAQVRGNQNARVADRNRGNARADVRVRGNERADVRVRGNERADARVRGNARPDARVRDNDRATRVVDRRQAPQADWRVRDRDWNRDGRNIDRDRVRWADWGDRQRWTQVHGLANGCPPGLANKNPLCMPPGQYRKLQGSVLPAAYARNTLPRELRYLYPDSDRYYYRYGDGYVYRVDRQSNLVSALLPLIGASLGIGQQFPYSSPAYHVPSYYQPFYPATDRYEYRYANGYIYEVDRFTGEITDIIPQYDRGYGVGQMLPAGYSYYNLPDPYRQWYVDDDDYYYRYAPGAIYRVNRESNLITSIVSLLATGLGVGQALPMGYDAYNVPIAYRDRYYDTPDHWYRYANGHIYQVDPTTRLITAVINAIA